MSNLQNVQVVITDTKQHHIETDLKALFRPDDDPARKVVILEVTRLIQAQSQSQCRTYASGQ